MARCNSIVGSFSGVVAYVNGTNGAWNCQMEWSDLKDLKWSINAAISQIHTANIDVANSSEYFATWQNMISQLPFVTAFSWGSTPPGATTNIKDVVHHLYFIMTFDDGTSYPISVTYENGARIDHLTALGASDLLTGADNAAAIISLIQEMLELVSDIGQPVMS